jgi:uncharacterized protein
MTGHINAIELLIAEGSDINAKDNKGGGTALMIALIKGRINVIELLIAKGSDVRCKG